MEKQYSLRSKVMLNDNSDVTVKCKKHYNLNETKAMQKKADGTRKNMLQACMKEKNLMIEFSTATYEMIKVNIEDEIVKRFPSCDLKKQVRCDRNSNIVETIYKVHLDNSLSNFVVNMWHTTSKIMVNGKGVEIFKREVFPHMTRLVELNQNQINVVDSEIRKLITTEVTTSIQRKQNTLQPLVNNIYNGNDIMPDIESEQKHIIKVTDDVIENNLPVIIITTIDDEIDNGNDIKFNIENKFEFIDVVTDDQSFNDLATNLSDDVDKIVKVSSDIIPDLSTLQSQLDITRGGRNKSQDENVIENDQAFTEIIKVVANDDIENNIDIESERASAEHIDNDTDDHNVNNSLDTSSNSILLKNQKSLPLKLMVKIHNENQLENKRTNDEIEEYPSDKTNNSHSSIVTMKDKIHKEIHIKNKLVDVDDDNEKQHSDITTSDSSLITNQQLIYENEESTEILDKVIDYKNEDNTSAIRNSDSSTLNNCDDGIKENELRRSCRTSRGINNKSKIKSEPNPNCLICKQYVLQIEEAVVCETCNAYVHYKCDEITEEDIKLLGSKEYNCKKHTSLNKTKKQNKMIICKEHKADDKENSDFQLLKAAYRRSENEKRELRVKEENSQEQIKELKGRIENQEHSQQSDSQMKGELKIAREHVKVLKDQIINLKSSQKQINDKHDDIQKEQKSLHLQLEDEKKENTKLKDENKQLINHQITLRAANADYKKKFQESKNDEVDISLSEENVLKQQIKEKNKEISTLKENCKTYEDKLESLVTELMSKERVTSHLCENLETLKFINKELELQLERIKTEMDDIKEDTKVKGDNMTPEFENDVIRIEDSKRWCKHGERCTMGQQCKFQHKKVTTENELHPNDAYDQTHVSIQAIDDKEVIIADEDIISEKCNGPYANDTDQAKDSQTFDEPEQEKSESKNNFNFDKRSKECKFYVKGHCRYGDKCKFKHSESDIESASVNSMKSIICKYYLHGRCNFGQTCKFKHDIKDVPICKFGESCKKGFHCQYKHESYVKNVDDPGTNYNPIHTMRGGMTRHAHVASHNSRGGDQSGNGNGHKMRGRVTHPTPAATHKLLGENSQSLNCVLNTPTNKYKDTKENPKNGKCPDLQEIAEMIWALTNLVAARI